MAQKDHKLAVFMKNSSEESSDFFEDTRAKDEQFGCLGLGHLCCILEAYWKHDSGTWCASLVDRKLVAVQWAQVWL